MKPPIEVLFETCANSLGRAVPPRTLTEFKDQCNKDRIMREGVRAVCEAMEKYANPFVQEIARLTQVIVELQKEPVIAE